MTKVEIPQAEDMFTKVAGWFDTNVMPCMMKCPMTIKSIANVLNISKLGSRFMFVQINWFLL